MATLRTKVCIADDGTITGQTGNALPPGEYEATITAAEQPRQRKRKPFPIFHVGPWPEDLPLRREEMYGDDGR